MQLQLQDFTTLVRNMAASVQGSARALIDLTTGSTLRAIIEANASIALWLQWLILQVLSTTRAATSVGADLDSWVADFALLRLPATSAAVSATFSRITTGTESSIPVGAQVKTADASQTFNVVADVSNPAFNKTTAAYSLASAVAAITLPLQAATPGSIGNIQAGALSLLATAIPGVDAVSNPAAATGGLDAEPDAALRARFANFIDSRSRATPAAIAFAIASLQQGLRHTLSENISPAGMPQPGSFVVTLDDGTGFPSSGLIAAVAAAVDAVRPVGTTFAVLPPAVLYANIALTLTNSDAKSASAISAAIAAYVANLPIGTSLPLSRIAQLAYAAAPAVTNVSAITLNAATNDLTPSSRTVLKPGTIVVS